MSLIQYRISRADKSGQGGMIEPATAETIFLDSSPSIQMAVIDTKLYCSTLIRSTLFEVVFCLVERVIEEINMMIQGFRVQP